METRSAPSTAEVLLSLSGICKSFGPVKALDNVNLDVRRGEVHVLIGENGAGKSTLMKILSGAYLAESGTMTFCGQSCHIRNPSEGRLAGIAMIYQELNLAPHLSVEENITLGVERSSFGFNRSQRDKVREIMKWMGHGDLDIDRPVSSLSISLKQIVEIGRALFSDAKLIVMEVRFRRRIPAHCSTSFAGFATRAWQSSTSRIFSRKSWKSATGIPFFATARRWPPA